MDKGYSAASAVAHVAAAAQVGNLGQELLCVTGAAKKKICKVWQHNAGNTIRLPS